MKNRRIILSFISLVFSFILFVVSTYAWYAISNNINADNIDITVDPGIITSIDITYYTLDMVYKYDDTSESIKSWDSSSSSWVNPSYQSPEDIGYSFSGIMMQQFDPMIPVNNIYNHIIVALRMTYDVDTDTNATFKAIASPSLADIAKSIFNLNASQYYYLSEVVNIQRMDTLAYSDTAEGTNIFIDLTSDFNLEDAYGELIYPKLKFYDQYGAYQNEIQFTDIFLPTQGTEAKIDIYFKISYYDEKILSILDSENAGNTIGTLPYIRFFQDIIFKIQEVES